MLRNVIRVLFLSLFVAFALDLSHPPLTHAQEEERKIFNKVDWDADSLEVIAITMMSDRMAQIDLRFTILGENSCDLDFAGLYQASAQTLSYLTLSQRSTLASCLPIRDQRQVVSSIVAAWPEDQTLDGYTFRLNGKLFTFDSSKPKGIQQTDRTKPKVDSNTAGTPEAFNEVLAPTPK